jgi:hypothetical protein
MAEEVKKGWWDAAILREFEKCSLTLGGATEVSETPSLESVAVSSGTQ